MGPRYLKTSAGLLRWLLLSGTREEVGTWSQMLSAAAALPPRGCVSESCAVPTHGSEARSDVLTVT